MSEIIFIVKEAPEGGYIARALGPSIYTEADSLTELHAMVRDAVRCHFEEDERPKIVRLHFVREGLSEHRHRGRPRRSILELQGLGKELWSDIDAQEYVDEERATWNG